ncbi:MAG: hypothetical protein WKF35_11395 [Ferruginibacter sp.]
MKKMITFSLAISALLFTATAQEKRDMNKNKKERTENHQGMKGKRDMMNDLNLTEAQRVQIKSNQTEYKSRIAELRTQALTQAQFNERIKVLHAEHNAKMASVLTQEQKAKMAEKKKSYEGKKDKAKKHNKHLKDKLNLTDDQSSKLKTQKQALKEKRELIKNDQSLSKELKKEKMLVLKNEAKVYRKNILTAEQLKKIEDYKKENKNNNSRKARK